MEDKPLIEDKLLMDIFVPLPPLPPMCPFRDDYSSFATDPAWRADLIWNREIASLLAAGPDRKIGLIKGIGQDLVYEAIEKKIKALGLADRVHILPLATSLDADGNALVTRERVNSDLAAIREHANNGWVIRGLPSKDNKAEFAIGGDVSNAWKEQDLAGYVTQQLADIAQKAPPVAFAGGHDKMMLEPLAVPAPIAPEFTSFKRVDTISPTWENIEDLLKKGQVPSAGQNKLDTILDHCMKTGQEKEKAANLLVTYSVKQIMGGGDHSNAAIEMVKNNRSHTNGHASDAMKVSFKSPEEAAAFSKKLLTLVPPVHSTTLGEGRAKTPQGAKCNEIYLTEDDLEKISKSSGITAQIGIGSIAYQTKSAEFAAALKKTPVHEEEVHLAAQPAKKH